MRIPAVRRTDLSPEHRALLDDLAGPGGEPSPFYGLLMASPELAAKVRPLGGRLRGSVSPVLFDLIALAVAGAYECDYEMAFHRKALREAGFTDSSVDLISTGKVPDPLARDQAVAVQYTNELIRSHAVPPALFAEAVSMFGTRTVVEMSALIGYIGMVCLLAKAFEIGEAIRPVRPGSRS